MDNAGWHAQRRAAYSRDHYLYDPPQRGPDGQYGLEHVLPLREESIGGLRSAGEYADPTSPMPSVGEHSIRLSDLMHLTAVQRSQALRQARMQPFLQFMVGPLLRYDTVDENKVWHGAALIVTADSGSIYEPPPTLSYQWDADLVPPKRESSASNPPASPSVTAFNLGPHPADPYSTISPLEDDATRSSIRDTPSSSGANIQSDTAVGQELWVYCSNGGTFTFWRFPIRIPLGPNEMKITYRINLGQDLDFYVPGRNQNMRWAAYSCNGFSSGVNPDDFRGPGFQTGYDPLWIDLLAKHAEVPFHVLVGGGDQLYCDGVAREPDLQEWFSKLKPDAKLTYPINEGILKAIDRFYFNHYCKSFRSGAFARANSSIPMLNMCDDHDLIDGFGSYPEDFQNCPVFNAIGSRGFFFFLLFQCFINVEVDGLDDRVGKHFFKSVIIGGPGPHVPFPSHSCLAYMGPQTSILLLDCRAERRRDQVCSKSTYDKVFARLYHLPRTVEHLIVQIGIPIAYPRLVFLEATLSSKLNPLIALGRRGVFHLSALVNKFNGDAELLDDLNDHWTAKHHKAERNWFILECQKFAKAKCIRVTFLSGDVHCAGVGLLKTLSKGSSKMNNPPHHDHRYMLNIVTSAIVNTPPPNGVITLVSTLASKTHRTLHHADTDECMIPLFTKDPDGSVRKQKYIMGRRNWCAVDFDSSSKDLVFDIRVEKVKGGGATEGYMVVAPGPSWDPSWDP